MKELTNDQALELLDAYATKPRLQLALQALLASEPNLVINFLHGLESEEANTQDLNLVIAALPVEFNPIFIKELYSFASDVKSTKEEVRETGLITRYLEKVSPDGDKEDIIEEALEIDLLINHNIEQILVDQALLHKEAAKGFGATAPVTDNVFNVAYLAYKQAVATGVDLKISNQVMVNEDGLNLLMYAAEEGDLELVRHLISKGFPLDLPNKGGYTALMVAVKSEHLSIAAELLQSGADPDIIIDTEDHQTIREYIATLDNLSEKILAPHLNINNIMLERKLAIEGALHTTPTGEINPVTEEA